MRRRSKLKLSHWCGIPYACCALFAGRNSISHREKSLGATYIHIANWEYSIACWVCVCVFMCLLCLDLDICRKKLTFSMFLSSIIFTKLKKTHTTNHFHRSNSSIVFSVCSVHTYVLRLKTAVSCFAFSIYWLETDPNTIIIFSLLTSYGKYWETIIRLNAALECNAIWCTWVTKLHVGSLIWHESYAKYLWNCSLSLCRSK